MFNACAGAIDWRPHLPRLFTAFVGLFDVPVGNSQAAGQVLNRPAPPTVQTVFQGQVGEWQGRVRVGCDTSRASATYLVKIL